MKKMLAVILMAAMMVSTFSGCSGNGSGETEESENSTTASVESSEEASEETSGETVTYGVLAPLTGDASVYGISTSNGIKMGAEDVNENGGILGKTLELEVMDEKADIAEATNAYNALRSQEVSAIIGDVTSKPAMAVAEIAAEEYADGDGIPVITPTGTTPDITPNGENIFRACYTDPFQGKAMATFAAENLGATKVAVMYNTSDDYSTGIANAFVETAEEKGIEIIANEGYGADDNDFKTQLTKIQALNPDAIMVPDYSNNVALIATQAREIGYDGVMLGADGWDGVLNILDDANKSVVNNCYFCNHFFINDTDEKVANFVKEYKETYGEDPTAFSALGYDAVCILDEATEKAGSTGPEAVVAAMQELEYDGVTGHITFDENGDPIKDVAILKLEDGAVTLETKLAAE